MLSAILLLDVSAHILSADRQLPRAPPSRFFEWRHIVSTSVVDGRQDLLSLRRVVGRLLDLMNLGYCIILLRCPRLHPISRAPVFPQLQLPSTAAPQIHPFYIEENPPTGRQRYREQSSGEEDGEACKSRRSMKRIRRSLQSVASRDQRLLDSGRVSELRTRH